MTTSFTKNMMLAVAACALTAGSAAAQSLEAQVPFSFRAGASLMAPGSYRVTVTSDKKMLRIHSNDTGNTILLLSQSLTGENGTGGSPKLRFLCAGTQCSLASLWVGGYEGAYRFPTHSLGRGETARVKEIEATRVKAD